MVGCGQNGMIGTFCLESQMIPGTGKFDRIGLGSGRGVRESANTAYNFLKAHAGQISGSVMKVNDLANSLQVCLGSGAKKVLIPSASFVDFGTVSAELMSAFQLIPYQSAEDAVFNILLLLLMQIVVILVDIIW